MKEIKFIIFILLGVSHQALSQVHKKQASEEGVLYFSLSAVKNGKNVAIIKDNGRAISKDSLKMANLITAYYKVGQKTNTVKDIAYDNFFLSDSVEPTILQDQHGLTLDESIWHSCIDSLRKGEQVVFEIREITLDDGTKIQNPKLWKEGKVAYHLETNPMFPKGGWQAKAHHWIDLWKDWFKLNDNTFYNLDDKTLDLHATGVVYAIKGDGHPASSKKPGVKP